LGSAYQKLGQARGRDLLQTLIRGYQNCPDQGGVLQQAGERVGTTPGPLTHSAIFIADIDRGGWEVRQICSDGDILRGLRASNVRAC
jgi:hypothetical protein